ncbi:MAG: hypothetical protein ABR905_02055 [Terracidiphilus sp.]
MIAKTILDLFTLLPGASRTAAQSSDQPLQAFSDSLAAATKSFSQGDETISASSKSVREQSLASGDATTSVAVLDGGDGLQSAVLESAQEASLTLAQPQAPITGLTTSDVDSADASVQSGQIQFTVEQAANPSALAPTGDGQSDFFAARLARAVSFQSRFTGIKTQRAGSATSRIVSTGVATRPFRNVTVTRLAGSQSRVSQEGAVPQDAVQPVITPVPKPFVEQATVQIATPHATIPITQTIATLEPEGTQTTAGPAEIPQSSASQSAVAQSNVAAVESSSTAPVATQRSLAGLAARFAQIFSAMGLSGIQKTSGQPNLVAATTPSQASASQPTELLSNITPAQMPLVATYTRNVNATVVATQHISELPATTSTAIDSTVTPAKTPDDSPAIARQLTSDAPTIRWDETGSIFTLAGILSTSIPRPARVQPVLTPAQRPLAAPITSGNAPTVETSEPTLNVTGVRSTEIQSTLPETSTPHSAENHTKATPAQTFIAGPTADRIASPGGVNQPAWNVTPSSWSESRSIFTLASILSSSIPRPTGVQSGVAPAQSPLAGPVTSGIASTVGSSQPTLDVAAAGWNNTGTSFVPAKLISASIPQPIDAQSSVASAQMPVIMPVTTQGPLSGAASQPALNLPSIPGNEIAPHIIPASVFLTNIAQSPDIQAASLAGTLPIIAEASFVQTSIPPSGNPQPVAAQPVEIPLTSSAATQIDSTAATGLFPLKGATTPTSVTSSMVAQASVVATSASPISIDEPIGASSKLSSAQMPLVDTATKQSVPAVSGAQQPAHNLPDAGWNRIGSSVTSTSIPQSAPVQLSGRPAQMASTAPVRTDSASIAVTNQPTQAMPASEWHPNIAPASTSQSTIQQSTAIQSNNLPVQTPSAVPAISQDTPTVATGAQPSVTAPSVGRNETAPAISPAKTISTSVPPATVVQSNATPAQTMFSSPKLAENAQAVATCAQPVPAAGWNENEPSVASATISQPVAVSATTQSASQVTNGKLATDVAGSTEVQSMVPAACVPQPAIVSANVTSVQNRVAEPARTQKASLAEQSQQSEQTVSAAGRNEAAPTNIAPAKISQTGIPLRAAVQSNAIPAQMLSAQPVATRIAATSETSEPARNVKATEPVETQTSIAQSSISQTIVSQKTVVEPFVAASSAAPMGKDTEPSLTEQPAAPIPNTQAPIAASPMSGDADKRAVSIAAPDAVPAASNLGAQDSPSPVAVNASSNAVQSGVANAQMEANPVPVAREAVIASVKDIVSPALKTISTPETNPQPTAAAGPNSAASTVAIPAGVEDQLTAVPQAASIGAAQTDAASIKSVYAAKPQAYASLIAKGTSTDQASAKKIADPLTESGSRSGSQDAASNGNQSQSGTIPQQNATPAQVDSNVHPAAVIATAQNTVPVATSHASSTSGEAGGVAAKTTDRSTVQGSTTLPQAAPVINTAKLVQSMGQSEMRVGMRSNEFGNISISTSAIRDQVSAQISVEHGELAKTLVAHLPEMQARLGSSQPVDVRIDMNGAATGQGTGNFGGTSNGSAGQPRGDRQPTGNMTAGQSGNGAVEQQFSPVVATAPSGYARLDIRV